MDVYTYLAVSEAASEGDTKEVDRIFERDYPENHQKAVDDAVQQAAVYGDTDTIRFFVQKYNANVNGRYSTALLDAAYHGHYDTVKYILSVHGDIEYDLVEEGVIVAGQTGYLAIMRLFVEDCGVDIDWTPEMCFKILEGSNVNVIKYMESRGVDWDALQWWKYADHTHAKGSMNALYYLSRNKKSILGLLESQILRSQYKKKMWFLDKLKKGQALVNPRAPVEGTWRDRHDYDPNLGMLIMSYVD